MRFDGPFYRACIGAHFHVLRYLKEKHNLRKDTVDLDLDDVIFWLVDDNKEDVILWLIDEFGLCADDLKESYDMALHVGNKELAEILCQ